MKLCQRHCAHDWKMSQTTIGFGYWWCSKCRHRRSLGSLYFCDPYPPECICHSDNLEKASG